MEFKENYIEPLLQNHFQKNISFIVDGVEYKAGKFLLYKFMIYSNNYYIEFYIQTNKKVDCIKIPYPFNIEDHSSEGLIYFDYRLKTICKNNTTLIKQITNFVDSQEDDECSKFYNKILEIKFE